MIKVITYGSYDLLHYGHIKLLERAKALGDYLIVGVTSDDYDKTRGKINLQQSLMERIEAVRATGLADEIIIEEYEGQKIDDIRKYDIDIFTVGSDWEGYFDYLNDYCRVIYLPRTEGVSSSEIREKNRSISLGVVGDVTFINKFCREAKVVNGVHVNALCTNKPDIIEKTIFKDIPFVTDNYNQLIDKVDAIYLKSQPNLHYEQIKKALLSGKHILCEAPLTLDETQSLELMELADNSNLILMDAIKTAYATAYERLLLLIKAGKIGEVISIKSTCTSLKDEIAAEDWSCIHEWAPTALLPLFQIMGTQYDDFQIVTRLRIDGHDSFTKMSFIYEHGCGSIEVSDGYKSEGDLIISGSKGYIYVPAPWWKTDYFEMRFEDATLNRRYYYQLDGEGIRYEIVAFARAVEQKKIISSISKDVSLGISRVMNNYDKRENVMII